MKRFDGTRCNPVAKPTEIEHTGDGNDEPTNAEQVTVS
jgi:hypothetical protein